MDRYVILAIDADGSEYIFGPSPNRTFRGSEVARHHADEMEGSYDSISVIRVRGLNEQ